MARAEGVLIAREMLVEARGMVQGVQVSAPFGRYTVAAEVIAEVLPADASSAESVPFHKMYQLRDCKLASIERSLKQLEKIVDQLERGDLPLEESIRLFEEGVRLSTACKQELETAEGKVQILMKERDGSIRAEPFPGK